MPLAGEMVTSPSQPTFNRCVKWGVAVIDVLGRSFLLTGTIVDLDYKEKN